MNKRTTLTREKTNYANELRPNEVLFKEFIIAATNATSCDEWDISFVGWKDRVARCMSEQFQLAGHPAKHYPPQTDADAAPLLSLPGSAVKV